MPRLLAWPAAGPSRRAPGDAELVAAPAPDLVASRVNAERPDELWLADATYLPTGEGWWSLAVVLDA